MTPRQGSKPIAPRVVQKIIDTFNGDILGLAGPGKKIAAVCPCTVIAKDDAADRLLDRKRSPDWQGERTQLMRSMPTDIKLWERYRGIKSNRIKGREGNCRGYGIL